MASSPPPLAWPAVHKRFAAVLGANRVLKRREDLLAYDCDGLTLHRHAPNLVVLPRSAAEVVTAVKLCVESGLPFVARGSGTGLSGGAISSDGAVVIVTSRMRRILDVDVDNQTILVEP
ncbi:FAD-binding oxidoreductase, partial [Candidatus Synechococcus spongiarum LMB bulk10D]